MGYCLSKRFICDTFCKTLKPRFEQVALKLSQSEAPFKRRMIVDDS